MSSSQKDTKLSNKNRLERQELLRGSNVRLSMEPVFDISL
jgi:hypothetical protein